jgi:signal transduction histidine kinase
LLDHPWSRSHKQGETRQILLSLAPVTAPDGNILGAICNLRDVTDFRRMEKRLQSQERLAALGEMAASVAHEIRNPLGTIEGFARLLRRDLEAMPAHLRLAERIVEGAQNLNYVITNLLTYARPMRLQVSPASVATIFNYCRETLEDRAARTGVCLVMNAPEPDITFRGDYRQITQALLNLGINAIEACDASGIVHISATESHNTVSLHVRDNGCGMDASHVSKVFDPFFTSKEGGTGLGLSLSRKIIDIHGGEISVTSAPGEGSLFSVELPKTGAEA